MKPGGSHYVRVPCLWAVLVPCHHGQSLGLAAGLHSVFSDSSRSPIQAARQRTFHNSRHHDETTARDRKTIYAKHLTHISRALRWFAGRLGVSWLKTKSFLKPPQHASFPISATFHARLATRALRTASRHLQVRPARSASDRHRSQPKELNLKRNHHHKAAGSTRCP